MTSWTRPLIPSPPPNTTAEAAATSSPSSFILIFFIFFTALHVLSVNYSTTVIQQQGAPSAGPYKPPKVLTGFTWAGSHNLIPPTHSTQLTQSHWPDWFTRLIWLDSTYLNHSFRIMLPDSPNSLNWPVLLNLNRITSINQLIWPKLTHSTSSPKSDLIPLIWLTQPELCNLIQPSNSSKFNQLDSTDLICLTHPTNPTHPTKFMQIDSAGLMEWCSCS